MNGHVKWAAALVWCAVTMTGCVATVGSPAVTDEPDDPVQALVDEELDRLVADGATRAVLVVLDPADGRVLGRGGRGPDGDAEVDRVVMMGSTIKPLTIAAALEAGLDPTREFPGEGGEWRPDASTLLRDAHPQASFTAEQVLIASSNVGAGKIVEAVGQGPIAAYFAEVDAQVPEVTSWPAHGAGIGVAMTPTSLAAAYGVFANGGELVTPTTDGTGARRRVLTAATARVIVDMLEAAVGDDGTGFRARIPGHRVAGKTGTTSDGAAVFAGVAPVDAPRYVIVVRAERTDGAWGGSVAAPSFARVASALLR